MAMFVVIPDPLISAFQNFQNGVNVFNAVQDNQGRWCASTNSIEDFPMLFNNRSLLTVELTVDDFPQPDPNDVNLRMNL